MFAEPRTRRLAGNRHEDCAALALFQWARTALNVALADGLHDFPSARTARHRCEPSMRAHLVLGHLLAPERDTDRGHHDDYDREDGYMTGPVIRHHGRCRDQPSAQYGDTEAARG